MDPNSIRHIPGLQPSDNAPKTRPADGTAEGTDFRRLLEQLESLSRNATPPAAPPADGIATDRPPPNQAGDPLGDDTTDALLESDSPESLARDLAKADDEFRSVMDLRRRLEDAFRNLGS